MQYILSFGFQLLERGYLPDMVTRFFARRLLYTERLVGSENVEKVQREEEILIDALRKLPTIAIQTDAANRQHYEVPAEFYTTVLGPRLKYSACQFEAGWTLAEAEDASFAMYMDRAQIRDGMKILDIGCGWGSLTLYLLEKYPNVTVECVSNSGSQKIFIENQARQRGFEKRLTVHKCDINVFERPDNSFDRIMSVEMFEHCKNYEILFSRITRWLRSGGKLFVHIFTFDRHTYHFEDKDETDWMAREFFAGGTMPSHELLQRFSAPLVLESKWKQNGQHYSRTLEAWLSRMDANDAQVRNFFAKTYGAENVVLWMSRWRTFFIACSECFGYNGGNTWYVSHYLWEKL